MSDDKKDIIAHLKARRIELGMTLADVALKMGREDKNPRSVVNQWERGAKVPDDASLTKWAAALGMEYRVTRELISAPVAT